jgi:hypothetical protein
MKSRFLRALNWIGGLAILSLLAAPAPLAVEAGKGDVGAQATTLYLPLVTKGCEGGTGTTYEAGPAQQWDLDNPPLPGANHGDKNIQRRGYFLVNETKSLIAVQPDPLETINPPQLATLFSPNRVPTFSNTYRIQNWDGSPVNDPPVTVLGFQTMPGETLHVPASGRDIGGGPPVYEALVMFADADTVALHYTREDSAAKGYTVHVDGICTDPYLLALYNQLDSPSGPRYVFMGGQFGNYWYNLPNLREGQVFGTAPGTSAEIRVAVVDTGAFLEPRGCTNSGKDFWETPSGACPFP